jgi:hypothetical protein
MTTKRFELVDNDNNKIVFGRTMYYDERVNEIGDAVKRFFEIAYNFVSDDRIVKSHLRMYNI